MSEGKAEQLEKGMYNSRGYKKYLKRIAKRLRRRNEKRDPENTAKKNEYFGWSY